MKKNYQKAEANVITLANEDVITASSTEKEPTGVNELEPDLDGIF